MAFSNHKSGHHLSQRQHAAALLTTSRFASPATIDQHRYVDSNDGVLRGCVGALDGLVVGGGGFYDTGFFPIADACATPPSPEPCPSLSQANPLLSLVPPDRWVDIEAQMAMKKSWLHDVYRSILAWIVFEFEAVVTRLDVLRITPLLPDFAQSVRDAGGLLDNVVCFIDGKAWATCRPGGRESSGPHDDIQRAFYSGYYKAHGLKAQNVMFCDGIRYIHVESIRDHDQILLEKSYFLVQLDHMFINGDIAYRRQPLS